MKGRHRVLKPEGGIDNPVINETDIIDPGVAKTLAGLFCERVRRTPEACAYRRFNSLEQRFEEISWQETLNLAARWREGLLKENLHAGDRVAVMLHNCLEWVVFDLAALSLGLVTVPLFADDRADSAAYILKETGCRLILMESEAQWRLLCTASDRVTSIDRILVFGLSPGSKAGDSNEDGPRPSQSEAEEPRVVLVADWLPASAGNSLPAAGNGNDLATIVYTSGTTGRPKGVMLSHANILHNAFACLQRENIFPNDVFLSFLPLSHTFERTVGYYIPMMAGASVAHARSVDKLAEDMQAIRPTILVSVPRIYERIHAKILAGLEQKPLWMCLLFRAGVHVGWRRFLHLHRRGVWTPVQFFWPVLNRLIAQRLMAGFGGRLRLSISGGAALALPIMRVFIGSGLNLLQGYGMTETSPVISFNSAADNDPTSVGCLLPGVQAVVAPDGELKVRGPNIMLGYWRNDEATRAAIDSDGYFHTGDIGRIDASMHLRIVGRIKEILVLSNGEKIPPADLEQAIGMDPLFEQAMIVGEGRPYLAALVVLNPSRWEKLAARLGLEADRRDRLETECAKKALLDEIGGLIRHFPGYAQIRRVHAMLDPWSVQDGLTTVTLKLRRKDLLDRFRREVDLLFKGHA
jgi:long-chain acyl-CoA synthetase